MTQNRSKAHPKLLDCFPPQALLSIVEAERLINDASRADYAPAALAFTKSFEILFRESVFIPFRSMVRNIKEFDELAAEATKPGHEQAANFTKFITKGAHFELGGMSMALRLCSGKTGQTMALMAKFKSFLTDELRNSQLLSSEFSESIDKLARNYRNPAVHSTNFTRDAALSVREEVLRYMSLLAPPPKQTDPQECWLRTIQ